MNTKKLTIGIDLGDRQHRVCVLSAAGTVVTEQALANTREVLTVFSARYPGATIIMETGTHSPWVSRLFQARGHCVHVANARKLRAISESVTKSDEEDARMLARLGRADPTLLSPIRHRSEATQRALVRLKVREALVRSRVNQINTVRFLLKSLGVFVTSSIKAMAFTRKRGKNGVRSWGLGSARLKSINRRHFSRPGSRSPSRSFLCARNRLPLSGEYRVTG